MTPTNRTTQRIGKTLWDYSHCAHSYIQDTSGDILVINRGRPPCQEPQARTYRWWRITDRNVWLPDFYTQHKLSMVPTAIRLPENQPPLL